MIAKFYRAPDGTEPVADFIDGLPVEARASVAFSIELLNELTDEHPYLPFPHSSQVEGELSELRCHHGRQLYRILYRRSENFIVLLHIFRKATARPSDNEGVQNGHA
jgi:phage-related protein